MRKEIFFIFLIIVGFGFVSSAQGQLVEVDYSGLSETVLKGPVSFSDVLLRVDNAEGLHCKYSLNSGVLYQNMGGSFDYLIGSSYYKNFMDLFDGNFPIYVKCQNLTNTLHEPGELEVILRINSLVTGQILLSEDSPLNDGRIDVNLITSKVVSQAPILTYSFDGVKYNPIVLVGSEKNWEGYIVLDRTLGEGVLSFAMKAVDLEGRQGTEIISGAAFPYDTVAPVLINDIKAISEVGEIHLEWHGPEDAEYFKIYRSTSPNPTYTDYYDETDDEEFTDDLIDKGKTYYYRITSVDASRNEAALSKEVSGVSLEKGEDTSTGLSPLLRGKVESFILEIKSLEDSVLEVRSTLNDLNEKEKDLFTKLKMFDKLDKTSKDILALKVQVENYKTQDLTSEELDSRIESSRVKLNVFEREIPSKIEILQEESRREEINEDYLMEALNELDNFLSEKEKEKSIKQTFELIEEYGVNIESFFYLVEIGFLEGSTNKFYVVKRNLNSQIEKLNSANYLEIIPLGIVENGKIEVKNLDHDFLKDNVIAFGADNKEMFYYVEGMSSFSDLLEIKSGFVSVFEESSSNSGLTGFAVFDSLDGGFSWIAGVIVLLLAGAYLIYARKNNNSDDYFRILNKISECSRNIKKNELDKSKKLYGEIKEFYKVVEEKEKKRLYGKIQDLYYEISILELQKGLEILKKNQDKILLEKLEKIYDNLPQIHKEKISTLFNKLKGEIENEK